MVSITVDQVLAAARAEEPSRRLARGVVALREVLESCIDEIRDRHALPGDAVALDAQHRHLSLFDAEGRRIEAARVA